MTTKHRTATSMIFVFLSLVQVIIAACPHPGYDKQGKVDLLRCEYTGDGLVTVECAEGYFYTGTRTRDCQKNGQWSGKKGVCAEIQCPPLPDPPHGTMKHSGSGHNETAEVVCDDGYIYSHPKSKVWTCRSQNTWRSGFGACEAVQCPDLIAPEYGMVSVPNRYINATAVMSCKEGYVYSGSNSLVCQSNGQWNGIADKCKGVQCPQLPDPPHGKMYYPGGKGLYHTAEIICDEGYKVSGISKERTCQADSSWSHSIASITGCEVIKCPYPDNPLHGFWHMSSQEVNDVIEAHCHLGYEYTGTPWVCQSNGKWKRTEGICQVRHCGTEYYMPLGKVSTITDDRYGSIIHYECNFGYKLSGGNTITCDADGTWIRTGHCIPVATDYIVIIYWIILILCLAVNITKRWIKKAK